MYHIEIFVARMLFWLLARCTVCGKNNIPAKGPVLIVANHLSIADPPALGLFIGRRSVFMAKEELFKNRLLGYFVRSFGAFPVRRGRFDRASLRQSERVLKQGRCLVMFPEGMRSQTGGMQRALPGSALIGYRNNVPILPVGISGTEAVRGFRWLWTRPKVFINIGSTFFLPDMANGLNRDQLEVGSDFIMRKIGDLLPDEYLGYYSKEEKKWK